MKEPPAPVSFGCSVALKHIPPQHKAEQTGIGAPLSEGDWLVEGDPLAEGLSELLVEAAQRGA